ncbi:hypothetical protein V2G26_001351 [Clonostachys chloroleuca]
MGIGEVATCVWLAWYLHMALLPYHLLSTCDPSLLPARPLSPSASPLCSAASRFLQKAALSLPISGPNPSQRRSRLPSSHRLNISFPSGSPA